MRRLILWIAPALAAIAAAPAGAQPAPTAPKPPAAPTRPTVEQATLANGLRIAVVRSDAAPVVSVQVWYRAGSKDEPRDRRGTAHMFEHLMFKGSKRVRPEAHGQLVNGIGGYAQALTDEDATHYLDTLAAEHLDFAIQLEAERMRNLIFRPEAIGQEREAMKAELRQQESSPLAQGFQRLVAAAFTRHPYAWTAGGHLKDLDAVSAAGLKQFYDAYYQPNNALLVVVGKTTLDAVKASAERHFGAIPKAPDPPRPSLAAAEPPPTSRRRVVAEPGAVGLTLIGFPIPAAKERDIYALQVASMILGVGEGSRLKVRIRATDPKTKQPYGRDAGAEAVVREEPGLLAVFGAYSQAAQGEAVEAALLEEISKLAATGPTAEELRRAKNQIQSGFTFSLENAQGLAQAVGRSWILVGDPGAFMRDIDEIEKLAAADVARVAKQYLVADKATIVAIPPKEGK